MDNNMLDILKNLDAAEKGEKVDGTPSTAASEKNAMKSLLEGLDSAQNSVKQMPGTHKMAKATDKKHPAGEYLVGGEEGEPEAGDEVVSEDPTSEIVPGAKVHVGHMVPGGSGFEGTVVKVEDGIVYFENEEGRKFKGRLKNTTLAEDLTESGNLRSVKVTYDNGDSMSTNMAANLSDEQIRNYYAIGKRFNLGDGRGGDKIVRVADVEILEDKFGEKKPGKDVHKKQSFADIFKSMDEANAEKESALERELFGKLQKEKELHIGDNGKADLAENDDEELGWGDEMIEDIKLLLQDSADGRIDLREELHKLIAIYEK